MHFSDFLYWVFYQSTVPKEVKIFLQLYLQTFEGGTGGKRKGCRNAAPGFN